MVRHLIAQSTSGAVGFTGRRHLARPHPALRICRVAGAVAGLVGVEHVSFGTDFYAVRDAAAYRASAEMESELENPAAAAYTAEFGTELSGRYPPDCRRLADLCRMTEAFIRSGWSTDDVKALLGSNLVRVLGEIWTKQAVQHDSM